MSYRQKAEKTSGLLITADHELLSKIEFYLFSICPNGTGTGTLINQSNQFISGGSFFLTYLPFINKGCATLLMALPFTLKIYLKGKRRTMETQIFHHAKIQSSNNPLKETKILQNIITL
jgi:hypothetical protein